MQQNAKHAVTASTLPSLPRALCRPAAVQFGVNEFADISTTDFAASYLGNIPDDGTVGAAVTTIVEPGCVTAPPPAMCLLALPGWHIQAVAALYRSRDSTTGAVLTNVGGVQVEEGAQTDAVRPHVPHLLAIPLTCGLGTYSDASHQASRQAFFGGPTDLNPPHLHAHVCLPRRPLACRLCMQPLARRRRLQHARDPATAGRVDTMGPTTSASQITGGGQPAVVRQREGVASGEHGGADGAMDESHAASRRRLLATVPIDHRTRNAVTAVPDQVGGVQLLHLPAGRDVQQ